MRQPFGQNFLVDTSIAKQIVDAAQLSPEDRVIEIGPGRGVLTGIIAPLVKELTAVELDRILADKLQVKFAGNNNVTIINQDFLHWPLPTGHCPLQFIANLPYNMATAIIAKILPSASWQSAVFMFQHEVAERITAECGTKQYGYLSLFCQYYAEVEPIMDIGPGAFSPHPRVDSTVVKFTNRLQPPPQSHLFRVIKAAFSQRRKTVHNALSAGLKISKSDTLAALQATNIEPMLRPEKLSLPCYQTLTFELEKYIIDKALSYEDDKTW